MKAKLLSFKAVFCLLFVLSFMSSTFCQVAQTTVDTSSYGWVYHISRTHLNAPNLTVDTLYWGPGPDEEDDCMGLKYSWTCYTPINKPDSVMICLFTKSDLKKIPLEIYTNNSQICSRLYKTTATLHLKIVEALTGGLEDTPCHGSPYEAHEQFWIYDSNANTIRISFDLSGTGIVDDEDMKFAISLLDSNGNVLFASNETWRNDPLVYYIQSEFGNMVGFCRLNSWNFKSSSPSEIKICTNWASDLERDTLVNDYSINLVKNTLHSPLFDHVAFVRLDFFPPTAKYDSILNEIEKIQKKIIELCGGQFIDEDDIAEESAAEEFAPAEEKAAPAEEEVVAVVAESEEAVETAEEWQIREPAETSGENLATSKRYFFSRKYLNSINDINFIRDFLLAPNCLYGMFLYPEDIETCIDYSLSGGLINDLAYFWYSILGGFIFDSSSVNDEDFPSKQAYTSQISMLLTDFRYFTDRIVKEFKSYDRTMHLSQEIPSFIVDTLIPITKAIPSHKQCKRFFELIFSWQKLLEPALDELRFMALNEDTTAQICLGQMLEQNAFLAFTDYNYDYYYWERRELSDYGTPFHWYVMAALNGSRQGEKELNRLLGLKLKYNDDYYGDGEYHEEYKYKSELHDELISLLEEYERQRVSQYSYDKRKDLLNKMIKEVRQNRIKERQKQEKEWEKERQKWNYNQEEAAETYAE